MIALYAAYYMLIIGTGYGTSNVAIPYESLSQCQRVAEIVKHESGIRNAVCLDGNSPH